MGLTPVTAAVWQVGAGRGVYGGERGYVARAVSPFGVGTDDGFKLRGIPECGVDFAEFVGVDFRDFAVVGEPAVEFVFDVGDLGIYDAVEGREADHCAEVFDPEAIVVFQGLRRWICGAGDVVDVVDVFGWFFVVVPGVTGDTEVESARFAEEDDAVIGALLLRCGRVEGVVVYVADVARAHVGPAAGTGDEARGVALCDVVCETFGVVLPPAFVEDDPLDNTGVIVQPVHDVVKFGLPLLCGFGGDALSEFGHADHVLPDQ